MGGLPGPGMQVGNLSGRMLRQFGKHVGQPSFSINVIELGGLGRGVHRGGTAAALVGAGGGPILMADSNGAQLAFGSIVVMFRRRLSTKHVNTSQRLRL